MTNKNILFIIILCLLIFEAIRKRIILSGQFNDLSEQTVLYILHAERNNKEHGLKAYKMLELVYACAFGKKCKKEYKQLEIFWKSKFGHLFKQ